MGGAGGFAGGNGRSIPIVVFPNHTGKPLERQNVGKRSFRPLLMHAELPAIRFHDLRHSPATLLLSLSEHPKVEEQEGLGHSTISVTMDINSHVLPDMQRKAAAKLDSLFGSAEAGWDSSQRHVGFSALFNLVANSSASGPQSIIRAWMQSPLAEATS